MILQWAMGYDFAMNDGIWICNGRWDMILQWAMAM